MLPPICSALWWSPVPGTRWRALPPVEEEDTLVDSHGAWTLQPAKCLMAFLHQGVPSWEFSLWASTCTPHVHAPPIRGSLL